jgi:hypothetical protein
MSIQHSIGRFSGRRPGRPRVARTRPAYVLVPLLWMAACSIAVGQFDTQRVARVVLLQDEPFGKAQIDELWSTAPPKTVEKRLGEGWHVEERANRLFLIAPGLWQGPQTQRLLALYRELPSAVGADGIIDTTGQPALGRFLEEAFQGTTASAAAFALQAVWDLTLTDGVSSRSVRLAEPLAPETFARLAQKPLAARSVGSRGAEDPGSEFRPARPASVYLHSWGTQSNRTTERADDLATGLRILADHRGSAREEFRTVAAALAGKMGRGILPPEALRPGAPTSQLPSEVTTRLRTEVLANYRQHGFATEEDASRFLSGSRIRTVHLKFGLSAASAPGGEAKVVTQIIPMP